MIQTWCRVSRFVCARIRKDFFWTSLSLKSTIFFILKTWTLPNAEFFIKIYSEGFLFIPSNFCALPLYLPHPALILFIIIHKLPSGSKWKASKMKRKIFKLSCISLNASSLMLKSELICWIASNIFKDPDDEEKVSAYSAIVVMMCVFIHGISQ